MENYINNETLVRDLLELDYKIAGVLFQSGIDFFKCTDMRLSAACERFRVDPVRTLLRIQHCLQDIPEPNPDFSKFSCGHIILYLIHTHHAHSRVTLPMIHYHIKKVEQMYVGEFPHVMMLNTFFDKFRTDFIYHLRQEEEVVFPYIHQLEDAVMQGNQGKVLELPDLSISSLNARHISDHEDIEDIIRLTNHFRFDASDPLPYRILMQELKDLYHNLNQHSDLEEKVLFFKAEAMEKIASDIMRKLLGLN
jgi:regulator of cell morphogenesis and NO signaling